MFATSGDILKMSLAMGFIVLVIFICIMIFYLILILRDVSKITDKIAIIVNRIHSTIVEPLKALDFIFEKSRPYIETITEEFFKKKGKKKK